MINHSYGGIGAIIWKPEKNGPVIINEPYEGSPAALAGLRCGDEILAIDGVTTVGLDATESSSRMKGKPGTKVTFSVRRRLPPGRMMLSEAASPVRVIVGAAPSVAPACAAIMAE